MATTECNCERCQKGCQRYPGWMTVDEAKRAMDAGHAKDLMRDYWASMEGNISVLCPAIEGYEGRTAAWLPDGKCVFFSNGKCGIHNSGFKPRQCRESFLCKGIGPGKSEFIEEWNSPEGKEQVRRFRELNQWGQQ